MAHRIPAFARPERPLLPTVQQHTILSQWLFDVGPYLSPSTVALLRRLPDMTYNPILIERLAQRPQSTAPMGTAAWVEQQTGPLNDIAGIMTEGLQLFTSSRRKRSAVEQPHPLPQGSETTGSTTPNNGDQIPSTMPSGANTPRSQTNVRKAAQRDGSCCSVTGLPGMEECWPLDLAHINPYGLANAPDCRTKLPFWKMADMFMGSARADALWEYVRGPDGKDINRLENLITLDPRTHRLFGKGILVLKPIGLSMAKSFDVVVRWLGPNRHNAPLRSGMLRTLRPTDIESRLLLSEARDLSPGETFRLCTTTDFPLPSRHLLEIHSALHEMRFIIGMGYKDAEFHRDDAIQWVFVDDYMDSDSGSESGDEDEENLGLDVQLHCYLLDEKLGRLVADDLTADGRFSDGLEA